MTRTTISSEELSADVASAISATLKGPVFILDQGKTTHVLMRFEDFQMLGRKRRNIANALAMPGAEDIAFETPRVNIASRPVDFS